MAVQNIKKASDKLVPQPFHDKLETMKTLFQQRFRINPLTESGFQGVLGTESMIDSVGKSVGELIGDAESRETYESVFANTMREVTNPFAAMSQEGADAMAPNSNYNTFARLNPWTILGYIARSKCLEMYNTINNDRPTVIYEYNISYVVKGTDSKKYVLPNAARDGTISNLFNLPEVKVDLDLVGTTGFSHLISVASGKDGTGALTVNEGWVSLPASSDIFRDSGAEFDPAKYAIERDVRIARLYWSAAPDTGTTQITGFVDLYDNNNLMTGEISDRLLNYPVEITYSDASSGTAKVKTLAGKVMGTLNLDTGKYDLAATNPAFKAVQFYAKVTNLANELGTVRAGNTKIIEHFDVTNRVYGTVPIAPEMSDDFNAGGEGVSFVAFMTDKITEAFANVRDIDMENKLDASFTAGPANHRLFPKLGGSAQSVSFPLAARGAGGGDPFSWQTQGLKNQLNFVFTQAETDTYFEDNVPRQWIVLGAEIDTQRIPDVQYTNYAGETDGAPASGGSGSFKYGFAVDTACGYADSFGRRVKVIGSKYKRHQNKPMRAVLKSSSIEQPTTIYFPYSFRVFSGISPEYRNRPALCVAARDYIGSLSCVQARVTLEGNTADLYKNMATFSAGK